MMVRTYTSNNHAFVSEAIGHSCSLDWIADSGTCSMALHHGGLGKVRNPGMPVRLADKRRLGIFVRNLHGAVAAVRVDGRAADHGANVVAIADGILEPLDVDHVDRLPAGIAVGTSVKCLAGPGGREQTLVLQRQPRGGRKHEARAAHQSTVALVVFDGFACQIKSHER